jgi:translation initiation factor 4G
MSLALPLTSHLQDVIELRQRYWVPRNAQAAPTTLAQVHQAGVPRAPPKAGDPSHFGKINKSSQPATFGPTSIFSKKDVKGCDTPTNSLPRTASSSNMFSMPSGNFAEPVDESVHPTRTTSRSPTRKNGVDFAQGGLIEVSGGRKKVNLLPRIFPVEAVEKVEEENGTHSDSEIDSPVPGPSMTEDEVKTKIAEDAKELWNVRNLNDAESYFVALPSEHRHLLVNELVTKALESKEDDVKLVSDVFSRVAESSACSPSSFEEGFAPSLEFLDDIAIDSPQAYIVTARLLCASRLSHKAVDSLAGNINTDGNPSVPPRHRLLQQYHQLA